MPPNLELFVLKGSGGWQIETTLTKVPFPHPECWIQPKTFIQMCVYYNAADKDEIRWTS